MNYHSERMNIPIAVTSRNFSLTPALCDKLKSFFSDIRFNQEGVRLSGEGLVEFLRGRVGAIIALDKLNDAILKELPDLRFISKYGVGLDNLDQEAMKKRGVRLGWTGGVNARSVSELTLCLALGMIRNVFYTSRLLVQNEWKSEGGSELTGKTVGVIGCGFVGKNFVRLLKPFSCRVLINDILDRTEFCQETGAIQVDKKTIFEQSDIVSLHVPHDSSTHKLINKETLSIMKPSSMLINTSRGMVVDEAELYAALQTGRLSGAAADVFFEEPPLGSPLLSHPRFFGTPHIGGSSSEAIWAMGCAAIDNLVILARENKA